MYKTSVKWLHICVIDTITMFYIRSVICNLWQMQKKNIIHVCCGICSRLCYLAWSSSVMIFIQQLALLLPCLLCCWFCMFLFITYCLYSYTLLIGADANRQQWNKSINIKSWSCHSVLLTNPELVTQPFIRLPGHNSDAAHRPKPCYYVNGVSYSPLRHIFRPFVIKLVIYVVLLYRFHFQHKTSLLFLYRSVSCSFQLS